MVLITEEAAPDWGLRGAVYTVMPSGSIVLWWIIVCILLNCISASFVMWNILIGLHLT